MQVPAEYQVIVNTLRELVQGFIAAAGAHPGRKREADDNSKKIGGLFWRINAGELPNEVLDKLRALVAAIQTGNGPEASGIQVRRSCSLVIWQPPVISPAACQRAGLNERAHRCMRMFAGAFFVDKL